MALLVPIASTPAHLAPMEDDATSTETLVSVARVGAAYCVTNLVPMEPTASNVSKTAPVKMEENAIRKPEPASVHREYPELTAKTDARPDSLATIAIDHAPINVRAGGAIGCLDTANVPPVSTVRCAIKDVLRLLSDQIASKAAIAIKQTLKDAILSLENANVRTDFPEENASTNVHLAHTDRIARKNANAHLLLLVITSRESV